MPTAPKMVAALLLALLGIIVSGQIQALLPENTDVGWFPYVNAAIGGLCGWLVVGTRAGRGWMAGLSNGFTGTAALVFWGLFVQACNEMVKLAMRHRYDGPVEAFAAVFEQMVTYGRMMLTQEIILTLVIGGLVAGALTEWAARHWR